MTLMDLANPATRSASARSNRRKIQRIAAASCLFLIMNAAQADRPATPDAMPAIVAHRGASREAPENTLAAFRLAWKQGADAIEGDFHLTADGHIVCNHDRTTKRTGTTDLVIADSTLKDLRKVDVGTWKGAQFRGESIATLAEVLRTVPDGRKILIEIKCGPEIVPTLKSNLDHCPLASDQIQIIAFNANVIAAAKLAMPEIKAFWLTSYKKDKVSGKWSPTVEEVLDTLGRTRADGLDSNANREVVDQAFVKRLREREFQFHIWTVDDPAVARHFRKLGVDSITTNRPEFLRSRLEE